MYYYIPDIILFLHLQTQSSIIYAFTPFFFLCSKSLHIDVVLQTMLLLERKNHLNGKNSIVDVLQQKAHGYSLLGDV